MVEPLAKNSLSVRVSDDRLIRAWVADGKVFYPLTFPETEVVGVAGSGQEDRSTLVLRSGVKIPVALPYEELEQKIYQPNFRRDDNQVLDLRDVTGEAATPKVAANTNRPPGPCEFGYRMPDGTIYAGISPDTKKPMYATPADAPLTMTFNEAKKYAAKLDAHGHKDWHVPTKAELKVLFNNQAALSGSNVSGPYRAVWYWSSSQCVLWDAWCQRFSDGVQTTYSKGNNMSVRCVR